MRKMLFLVCTALIVSVLAGAEEKPIVLVFGNETAKGDSQYVGAEVMAKIIKEKSDGKMIMELHPGGELGKGPEQVEKIKSGKQDLFVGGAGMFSAWDGRLNVFDIPYLFDTVEQAHNVLDSDFGAEMLEVLEPFGVKGLAFWENGIRSVTNNKSPINTPEDLVGLKIRIMAGNQVHVDIWKLFGTEPFPMPYNDIYEALKTGKVDGQEHPVAPIYSGKFHEVQKYMSMTRHVYGPLIMVMNKAKFDSLTPDQQKILVEAAKAGAAAQRKFIKDNEAKFIADMEKAGMQINEVDATPFKAKVRPTIEKAFVQKNGDAWLKKIESMLK